MTTRRDFLALAGATVVLPRVGFAQAKVPRVALVTGGTFLEQRVGFQKA